MPYVDGFVLPIPKKNDKAYQKMARLGAKIWMEHGALAYYECRGDDVPKGKVTDFYRSVKAKPGEAVYFSFVIYKSRAHRDRVMKKVMADPRMHMDPAKNPFDMNRMIFGGFKAVVVR